MLQQGLTPRQLDLLEYLRDFIAREGHSPSFVQMMAALHYKSKGGLHRLVDSLEERGYISRLHNRSRAIVLTQAAQFAPGVEASIAEYCRVHRVERDAAVARAVEHFFGSAA